MDSKLLAGAYSKRYKYIERDQIETIKAYSNPYQNDALARARRLSQETNKRRKVAAQKRKQEQTREEKRRQEILNKRHEEQKQATEKYQRCQAPTRPHYSSSHHGHSPQQSHMDLEEALQLVRGTSAPSHNSADRVSREAIQRLYNHTSQEHQDRSNVRTSRASSAGSLRHQNQKRPVSGRPLEASIRAELMERSMRNMASSRSRFEQQLEQHQQLMIEQQQKSLHAFNQAIRREIDDDAKVQGVEDREEDEIPERSESLSSLDSLEDEENQLSLGNSLQDHQALKDFHRAAEQHRDQRHNQGTQQQGDGSKAEQIRKTDTEPAHQSARSGRGDVGPGVMMNSTGNSHVVGPIPQGYYSPVSGVPPFSSPVIQGNLSYYQDSLEGSHSPERRVGMALRLPQQPAAAPQPMKQPAPALQYNSQLLAHRKFDTHPDQSSNATGSKHYAGGGDIGENSRQTSDVKSDPPAAEQPTSALTQNERPVERPKAHVYAWTSPPPVEEQDPGWPTQQGQLNKQATSDYSAEMVADRVMATNLHPQTSRNISTAATTTWIYQTVNTAQNRGPDYSQAGSVHPAQNRGPDYSQAGSVHPAQNRGPDYSQAGSVHPAQNRGPDYSQAGSVHPAQNRGPDYSQAGSVHPAQNRGPDYSQAGSVHPAQGNQTNNGAHPAHTEIPRGQGQKPGGMMTSTGTYPATTCLKFVASMPPSFQGCQQTADYRQQVADNQNTIHSHSVTEQNAKQQPQQGKEGSVSQGTLGLVNGRLTIIENGQTQKTHVEPTVRVVECESVRQKEVRGILKKLNRDSKPAESNPGQSKFNVQDSVEIAKKHMHHYAEAKKKRMKKAVRFADLHYEDDVEEDTDSSDSLMGSIPATKAGATATTTKNGSAEQGMKSTPQRPRPASARVTSTAPKSANSRPKGARVASAGPARHPTIAARPKAAAHIIMSGEAGTAQGNHGNDSTGTAGITVHKSQLEKKVHLINNNFMSRVPVYSPASSPAGATTTPASTATVYTMSGTRNGTTTAHSTNCNTNANGLNRTAPQAREQGRGMSGKSAAPALHTTTILPSHSHFSNANNPYKAVYSENGLRIDRTPTDDEINNLWKHMRTMLDVSDGKGGTSQSSSNNSNNTDTAARTQVHVSHQYIDGAALGIPNGMSRVGPSLTGTKTSPPTSNGSTQPKMGAQGKNGYLQRYSLLQQRRNQTSGMGATARTNGVVEQTVQPMNGTDPRYPGVNVSYAPREEMTESMAGFLAAEQAIHAQGGEVRESKVVAAMESAQKQQEMYNSIRQKVARGGPSALSMEEHRLLESLDKLNNRLNVVENGATGGQSATNYGNSTTGHQIYVHRYL
ncbi:mediator of RNA polymerase II transcription subunit 12-like isoform X2 [Littorina saxatilis]|uniref:Uncharacterized protein n=1 Tax=Littorina saxatilis TaxID=31220 RepID=A0AAN9BL25_9CAEN